MFRTRHRARFSYSVTYVPGTVDVKVHNDCLICWERVNANINNDVSAEDLHVHSKQMLNITATAEQEKKVLPSGPS